MSLPARNAYARAIVWSMFRDAADEDYAVARWAFSTGLIHQFCWSAQQAIEKVLKSVLLLNGEDISNSNHELLGPLERAQVLCGDLLPNEISLPDYFPEGQFYEFAKNEEIEELVGRFQKNGHSSHRYRLYSLSIHGFDVHKLDELYFILRRVAYPLSMSYEGTSKTYRTKLQIEPRLHPHEPFRKLLNGDEKKTTPLLPFLRLRNFAFYEDSAVEAKSVFASFSGENSQWSVWTRTAQENSETREALEWAAGAMKMNRHERIAILEYVNSLDDPGHTQIGKLPFAVKLIKESKD